MPLKRPESILLVVFTEAADVLLLKRKPPIQIWQSVTGSLKWHERDPREAAMRELREETGLKADAAEIKNWRRRFEFEILPELRHRYPKDATRNVEHMYSLRLDERVDVLVNPKEHEDYRWESIDEAIELVWSWTNREALMLIKQDLGAAN